MIEKFTYAILAIAFHTNFLIIPVRASTLDFGVEEAIEIGEDILNSDNEDFETFLDDALDYVINILGEELGNDCPEILRIIPGPCPSGESIENIIIDEIPKTSGGYRTTSLPSGELFNSNPTVVNRDFANLYDQEYARAQADRLLGENGSQWLDENVATSSLLVQENEVLVSEIADLAKEAHTLEVTQDVMKNLTQIQSHTAKMDLNQSRMNAMMQASLLSVQQQQASLMQLSANVGEALDEANRRERLEREATYLQDARSLIYIPGFKW